ncbi:hypothetical protein N658DRAFT_492625 [Parathielavia hyrcaniae]|uniref:G-patch domain-containing protein n=1 Tax=Parathielavia hyrcaniae TaxID=113614 RepID=A0AAN6Q6N6_9PEZI|nr:hypothetical protein N658DRAFT_492625 [Parathielavia hyrcaniae]
MSPSRSAAPVPNDATGDDAYARRLVLSGMAPPPPPPATTTTDTATISRAPVRYSPPPPPPPPPDEMDIDAQDDYDPEVDYTSIPLPPPSTTTTTTTTTAEPDEQQQQQQQQNRTARPGQKDFARRLMTKYGWTKGTGLGASASGITSALRVEVEKRRRKPDAQGGGFADPKGGRGRIIAPKSTTAAPHSKAEGGGGDKEAGRFGNMSVVVLLEHMLENMADLEAEVEAGLGQEIGEECGERYGRVERIVVDVEGRRVFIRFVEAVSALRVSASRISPPVFSWSFFLSFLSPYCFFTQHLRLLPFPPCYAFN